MARRAVQRGAVVVLTVAMLVACTTHASHRAASTSAPPLSAPAAALTNAVGSTPAATPAPSSAAVTTPAPIPSRVDADPCGRVTTAPTYAHVVWIWMENKPYGSVVGSAEAPYENALAKACGLATDYRAITHPSLPNYLAATGGSTFGVTDDAGPSSHPIPATSLFQEVTDAKLSWRAYDESMPTTCDPNPSGRYAVKHNPAVYYIAIRQECAVDDVPLENHLSQDIAAGTLPSFAFVTPNLCDDTHDCSVQTGDAWLATWIPRIVAGPNYSSGSTLIVLTWDEGVGASNLIPTIVIGPTVPAGTRSAAALTHYSLLRTTEELLGLPTIGAATTATSMASTFDL